MERVQHFFTKNNTGSYMKALSKNYKPVFMELKNLIKFLKYNKFVNSFRYQRIS